MWRRSLLDIKVRRRADVGSDHHLVTAFIRVKLRKNEKKSLGQKRYNVSRPILQDQTVEDKFVIQLKNRFQALSHSMDYENRMKMMMTLSIGSGNLLRLCTRKTVSYVLATTIGERRKNGSALIHGKL